MERLYVLECLLYALYLQYIIYCISLVYLPCYMGAFMSWNAYYIMPLLYLLQVFAALLLLSSQFKCMIQMSLLY